ncbi:hypothetical protein [Dyella sp. 2YAF14]|uniref:hypothetical protein n=1 Tax=Dyella sp. 2YAF14 TaxID=3233025 RepID=UPI003F8EA45F
MELKDAAALLRAWASREGMLFGDQVFPDPAPEDVNLISGRTVTGREILRSKQIQAVGFSEADAELLVYLRRATPGKKALESLPDFVEDFPIKYRQGATGTVDVNAPVPFGAPYALRGVGNQVRYTCGSSISVGNVREAGTLGCLVRDAQGELYGLSNNHVSGSCSQAPIGLPIVAPGILDVSANNQAPFTIGFHAGALQLITGAADVVPYQLNSDAAKFRINNPQQVSSYQQDAYDTPATTMALAAGMDVEKVGRTTGHKVGVVQAEILGPFSVPYHAAAYDFSGPVYFDSVFAIAGLPASGRFSDGGDSGSLIVHRDAGGNMHAVGIVFAGMQDNKAPGSWVTLALPIEPILASLGMTLVSGHNI